MADLGTHTRARTFLLDLWQHLLDIGRIDWIATCTVQNLLSTHARIQIAEDDGVCQVNPSLHLPPLTDGAFCEII